MKIKESTEQQEISEELEQIAEDIYFSESGEEVIAELEASEIEYIEPNYVMEFLADPNDTYYSQQKTYLTNVGAETLWDHSIDGTGTTIAVLDSGLVLSHEDINYENILSGKNYYDDTTNTEDTLGHGTQITGLLSAVRNNGMGIAGLLSGVKILPLKISMSIVL